MSDSQIFLQELIDIFYGKKKLEDTTLSGLESISGAKMGISKLLRWCFVQDFPGDTAATELDVSFSSRQVIQLVNASSELQKYFQIKDGALAFADAVSEMDALEMIRYVKENYRPVVNF